MRIDAVLAPFELVRRNAWRLSARTSFGRRCVRDPALRLQTMAIGHMLVALALALMAPAWLLLLGPIILGVPHVASDVRHLLIRPPCTFRWRYLILAPLLAMVAMRVWGWLGGPWSAELELGLGLVAAAAAMMLAPLGLGRRVLGVVLLGGMYMLLQPMAHGVLLVFAHAHNAIAIAAWLALYRREATRTQWFSVAAVWLAAVGLLWFWPDATTLNLGPATIGAFSLATMAETLAPAFDPDTGARLVLVFAFAQSAHYAVWLRLVPQSLDPRPAPPTLQRSVARIRADFGRFGFPVLVAAVVAVPLLAMVWDAEATRVAYLTAAVFHGWLELAVFGALLAGAGGFAPPRNSAPGAR
jgi:hypothetical protein